MDSHTVCVLSFRWRMFFLRRPRSETFIRRTSVSSKMVRLSTSFLLINEIRSEFPTQQFRWCANIYLICAYSFFSWNSHVDGGDSQLRRQFHARGGRGRERPQQLTHRAIGGRFLDRIGSHRSADLFYWRCIALIKWYYSALIGGLKKWTKLDVECPCKD